jgi:hypothetical protein
MKSAFARCCRLLVPLSICLLIAACGGSSNTPANLQIQFSPAAPTVAVNSSIQITANTTPNFLQNDAQATWSIAGEGNECIQAPPTSACPSGTLQWVVTAYQPLTVTYNAPSTPGTYQVSLQAKIFDISYPNKVDYQGSATLPVIVTAQ